MGGTPFPGDGVPGVISSRAVFRGTAFRPGLNTPLTVLPSWSITTTIRLCTVKVGPQCPTQVPLAGCPSWAGAEAAHSSNDMKHTRRMALADMLFLGMITVDCPDSSRSADLRGPTGGSTWPST